MTGTEDPKLAPPERRRVERRADSRLADLAVPEFRKAVVTALLFAVVLALFIWMVRTVIIGGIIGVIFAVYTRPLFRRLSAWLRSERAGAIVTLVVVIVPFVAMVLYSYMEIRDVVRYVQTHETEIAQRIDTALNRFRFLGTAVTTESIRDWVVRISEFGASIPGAVREALADFTVSTAVLLFTTYYILTDRDRIVAYLRSKIPPRYAPLIGSLEGNSRAVLYGAIYATLVTQALKTAVIFALNVVFGVPLATVLALASFVIGFFPIVGSWSVYVPVAAWLFIFRDATGAAIVMLLVGFFVNTLLISTILRPKLAAEKSRVLNFYWMFIGLVTGVYTFGIAGLLLGPILIGLLKAIIDTVTAAPTWRLLDETASAPTAARP